MKNYFLLIFTVISCQICAETFTASEIISGTTRNGVTVSQAGLAAASKSICSGSPKENTISIGNSASDLTNYYIQISSTADINSIVLHGGRNSTGAANNIALLYWSSSTASTTTQGEALVPVKGYDQPCSDSYMTVSIPAGIKTIRIYRRISKYDVSTHTQGSGSNYGDGQTVNFADIEIVTTPAGPSTDATLSDLKVDGVTVTGFAPNTTNYNVTIPATQTTAPVVTATKNDSKAADPTISQATLPAPGQTTTATVTVTAEDGTTTKTYTITFTRAELSHDADLKDIKVNGTSITSFAANTTTYNVTVPFSATTNTTVTATTNHTAASAVVTGPNAVTGTATIVVTAEDGTTTKTYTVNITKAAASNDANLKELKYNGTSVPNFSAATLSYSVELPFGTTAAANVTATANYSAATVQITQPTAAVGTATVIVTAEDGTATKTYTITFTVAEENLPPVPSTTLTLHTPGTYEEKSLAGGYETPLTVLNGREYEVYYSGRGPSNNILSITTSPQDKVLGITKNESTTYCQAKDDWFEISMSAGCSSYTIPAIDEFVAGSGVTHKIQNNGTYKLHIKGYDQFSIYAMDNNADKSKGKYIEVRVDNILQNMTLSSTASVRRFNLTTGEHVIEVKGLGSSNDQILAFSLRIAQEPRLKKIKGNDSTQNVLVTTAIKPVTYFTKYNAMGRTELIWDGAPATGITLNSGASSTIGDTLLLSGIPMCATGVYTFHVSAFNAQNKETSRENGKITISTKIQRQTPDSLVDGFTGEAIEDIQFRYYAMSADSVTLTWNGAKPNGITASGTNGIYTITGTPTQIGDFPFTISVRGGNSIVGMLRVQNSDLGEHPILYLYKNTYDNAFFQSMRKSNNLIARRAKSTLRETSQYAAYELAIISEDVDANNEEVLALAEGQVAKPVLNMKNFSYATGRLGWGDPDNGSLVNTQITVMQPTHPVFAGINVTEGSQIQVLDTVVSKGLMPVKVEKDGSLCLATAMTRGRDYNSDGELQTFLHEIPAAQHNGQKYLLFPLAVASAGKLTAQGQQLLQNCINYLKGSTSSSIALPELQITSFAINGTNAAINQNDDIIELTMPAGTDLTAVTPVVTVKDSKTHAMPKHWNKDGVTVNLSNDYMGLDYIVTDYINVRTYTVYAHIESGEGLESIYAEGEWVNIYDMQGRKIMTTNESVRQLSLENGLYIVVTSRGSFKIMR